MHKLIFILSTFLIAGLYLWMKPEQTQTAQQENKHAMVHKESAPLVAHTDTEPAIQAVQEQTIALQDNTASELFEDATIDEVSDQRETLSGVNPIAAFRMKKHQIKEMKVGDTFTLPSVDGNSYTLKIANHSVSQRGNVSLEGHFDENGNEYSVVLTEGESAAFISMSTPEGNYEITVENGLGLVYATADIENARINYQQNDQVKYH